MKTVIEHTFTGETSFTYDSTKTTISRLMSQVGGSAGPASPTVARPMEASTAIPIAYPHVIAVTPTKHWVFGADNAAAAATRRIVAYEYDLLSRTWSWRGFITMNFVTNTGNKTITGLRMTRHVHTTGTVAVSGTAVTGTSTQFATDRMAVGARIGFGSSDPTQITTWYQITAIASDTGLTLGVSAGTIAPGTAYVIEELRAVVAIRNATPANGGLFVVKGLNWDLFQTGGTSINEAGTADNVRGIFWLADAVTVTNTAACGIAVDSVSSNTEHFAYVVDGASTARVFKYNLRTSLTSITAGKSVAAFVFSTGVSPTLTGTLSATNNGRIVTCSHGPGSGVKSLYFVTTTRIYRARESDITNGNTLFITDNMVEIPPGSASTFLPTSVLSSIDYSDSIDRFIVLSSGNGGARSYVTQYRTDSGQMDHIFLVDTKQTDQSLADPDCPPIPSPAATIMSAWSEAGMFYLTRNGATAALNQIYAVPCGADWAYAATTGHRVITPALPTSAAAKLVRAYTNTVSLVGSNALGYATDGYRVLARTSGIDDDSGAWVTLNASGDLSGLSPGTHIQFAFEFRCISPTCLASRITSVAAVYEDGTTISEYRASHIKSVASTRTFAWRQVALFGGTVPTLQITIRNAASGATVLVDDSATPTEGTWEYSTDGTTWLAWSTSADTVGNYIRYTATTLPAGIAVVASVTRN